MNITLEDIKDKMKDGMDKEKWVLFFKPTERTCIKFFLPHKDFAFIGRDNKKHVFPGNKYYKLEMQTFEKDSPFEQVMFDDYYDDFDEAAGWFYRQIQYCYKMYGRIHKPLMQWWRDD